MVLVLRSDPLGVDHRAGVVDNIGHDRNDMVDLLPAVGQVLQKHRNIVIRVLTRLAPRRESNSTTRSIRSPYSSTSAARKRFRIGSSAGRTIITCYVVHDIRSQPNRTREGCQSCSERRKCSSYWGADESAQPILWTGKARNFHLGRLKISLDIAELGREAGCHAAHIDRGGRREQAAGKHLFWRPSSLNGSCGKSPTLLPPAWPGHPPR